MNYLRRMLGWKHQVVQELHWETDNIVLSAPPWEAQGLYWRKREPENKANPSSRLTRASAHIHSHTGVTLGTRGGPLKSYDSGELLSWGQRKHPPLLGPLTQVTLRGLFSISLSSWFMWSNYLGFFRGKTCNPFKQTNTFSISKRNQDLLIF